MRGQRIVAAAVLVALAGGALAGCGGEGEQADDVGTGAGTGAPAASGTASDPADPASAGTGATDATGGASTGSSPAGSPSDATSGPVAPPPVPSGGACPEVPQAAGATAETTAAGDVDGDGDLDTIVGHQAGADWRVRVELAAGGSAEHVVPGAGVGASSVVVHGGIDVDGDSSEEVVARVGSGAGTQIIGLFVLQGCDLVPVVIEEGPAEFPVGATVGGISGVQCGGGEESEPALFWYQGTSDDGLTFDVETIRYTLDGDTLTVAGVEPPGTASVGDELYTAASTFHCDDVTIA
ncbi:MAG: hypothetical protein MUF83_06495 [Acidimicrobiales bacterium]|jgi:hypothetical protein|nr:hypothetical protein [Acidimicrobiales bacterium]